MEYAFEITNMYKRLDAFELGSINMKLEPGYIMGLVGPNGAGKTTLLLTLLGLYQPNEGSIQVFGYNMKEQEKEAKVRIGFVLEENPFLEYYSAKDNARMYGGYYPRWDQKTFEKYCKQFEVNIKKPLKKLSKGNLMKFQLAFALSHNARLLVFDEPTSGLDPVFRRELTEIMCDIISEGDRSIIYSTHLTEELDKIADFITFIYNGKQQFSSSKEELMEQYGLVRGSARDIAALEAKLMVGKRITETTAEALVRREDTVAFNHLTIVQPTIEDIMYYTLNGI